MVVTNRLQYQTGSKFLDDEVDWELDYKTLDNLDAFENILDFEFADSDLSTLGYYPISRGKHAIYVNPNHVKLGIDTNVFVEALYYDEGFHKRMKLSTYDIVTKSYYLDLDDIDENVEGIGLGENTIIRILIHVDALDGSTYRMIKSFKITDRVNNKSTTILKNVPSVVSTQLNEDFLKINVGHISGSTMEVHSGAIRQLKFYSVLKSDDDKAVPFEMDPMFVTEYSLENPTDSNSYYKNFESASITIETPFGLNRTNAKFDIIVKFLDDNDNIVPVVKNVEETAMSFSKKRRSTRYEVYTDPEDLEDNRDGNYIETFKLESSVPDVINFSESVDLTEINVQVFKNSDRNVTKYYEFVDLSISDGSTPGEVVFSEDKIVLPVPTSPNLNTFKYLATFYDEGNILPPLTKEFLYIGPGTTEQTSFRTNPDKLYFTYDGDGNALPTSQTISIDVQKQNISGSTIWTSASGVPALTTQADDSASLTIGDFASSDSASYTATADGFFDRFTITKIQDGVSGSSGFTALLTNENHTLVSLTETSVSNKVVDYSGADTEFQVFHGLNQLTYNQSGGVNTYKTGAITYTPSDFIPSNGLVGSVPSSDLVLTITDVDYRFLSGSINIPIYMTGSDTSTLGSITKKWSINKNVKGDYGLNFTWTTSSNQIKVINQNKIYVSGSSAGSFDYSASSATRYPNGVSVTWTSDIRITGQSMPEFIVGLTNVPGEVIGDFKFGVYPDIITGTTTLYSGSANITPSPAPTFSQESSSFNMTYDTKKILFYIDGVLVYSQSEPYPIIEPLGIDLFMASGQAGTYGGINISEFTSIGEKSPIGLTGYSNKLDYDIRVVDATESTEAGEYSLMDSSGNVILVTSASLEQSDWNLVHTMNVNMEDANSGIYRYFWGDLIANDFITLYKDENHWGTFKLTTDSEFDTGYTDQLFLSMSLIQSEGGLSQINGAIEMRFSKQIDQFFDRNRSQIGVNITGSNFVEGNTGIALFQHYGFIYGQNTFTKAYFDVHISDSLGNLLTYTTGTAGDLEYEIRDIKILGGTISESIVSNQKRFNLVSMSSNNAFLTFNAFAYANGDVRFVKDYMIPWTNEQSRRINLQTTDETIWRTASTTHGQVSFSVEEDDPNNPHFIYGTAGTTGSRFLFNDVLGDPVRYVFHEVYAQMGPSNGPTGSVNISVWHATLNYNMGSVDFDSSAMDGDWKLVSTGNYSKGFWIYHSSSVANDAYNSNLRIKVLELDSGYFAGL